MKHSFRLRTFRLALPMIAALFLLSIAQLPKAASSLIGESLESPDLDPPSTAVLILTGNESIAVNGAKALSGTTILSGSTLTTPNEVGARVALRSFATLEVAPNSNVKTEFDDHANVKVTLDRGCVILRALKLNTGEVITSGRVAGRIAGNGGAPVNVCFPEGQWRQSTTADFTGASLLHLTKLAVVAVLGGTERANGATGLDDRGNNPGPSRP